MKITDPLTNKSIEWTVSPESPMFTVPIEACTDDRSLCRWNFSWENPNLAVKVGNYIYVAGKTWQGGTNGLWKYDANTLAFITGYTSKPLSLSSFSDVLLAGMHVGTALIPNNTTNNVEYFQTDSSQAPGNVRVAYYHDGDSSITETFVGNNMINLDFEGATFKTVAGGNSAYASAYMPKTCAVSGGRIIAASWYSASSNFAASIFRQSTDTYSTPYVSGWTKIPLLVSNSTVTRIGTDKKNVVATLGSTYSDCRLGAALSQDSGVTWQYIIPSGVNKFSLLAVPATGLLETQYNASGNYLSYDGAAVGPTIYSPNKILVNGNDIWISVLQFYSASGETYANWSGDSSYWMYNINIATTGFNKYGPFYANQKDGGKLSTTLNAGDNNHAVWWNTLETEWNGSNIRCARTIQKTNTNPYSGYVDYSYGGPAIGIYNYDITTPTVPPTLIKTIGLDGLGNPVDYIDKVWAIFPFHEQGYGDHQIYLGVRWVEGTSGILATNISDQRPTNGSNPNFHFSRLKLIDVTK